MPAPKPFYVTVRSREWHVEVPAIRHPDGTLEFAAGNTRPENDDDVVRPAKGWQISDFKSMRASHA